MKPCIHGHTRGRQADGRCKECQRLRNAKRHAENPGLRRPYNVKYYVENKDKIQKYRTVHKERDKTVRRVGYSKNRAVNLIKSAKCRARKIGLPFDLEDHTGYFQSVIDAGTCQVTGLPFDLETGKCRTKRNPFSPSLDRVKPKLGYVRSNVRVVIWALNIALADWGTEVYAKVADAYLSYNKISAS